MRSRVLALVFGLMASTAVPADWGKLTTISDTMGVNPSTVQMQMCRP